MYRALGLVCWDSFLDRSTIGRLQDLLGRGMVSDPALEKREETPVVLDQCGHDIRPERTKGVLTVAGHQKSPGKHDTAPQLYFLRVRLLVGPGPTQSEKCKV